MLPVNRCRAAGLTSSLSLSNMEMIVCINDERFRAEISMALTSLTSPVQF